MYCSPVYVCLVFAFTVAAISCGDPGVPTFSRRIGSNFTYAKALHYECVQGYEPTGSTDIVCQADSKWNGSLPVCQPISCPKLISPAASIRNGSNCVFRSMVGFQCVTGYDLVGSRTLQCLWNRQWSHELPACVAVQCHNITMPNAYVIAANSSYGGQTMFQCASGFRSAHAKIVFTCKADRSWMLPNDSCLG